MKKLLTFLAGAVFIALATEQVTQAKVLGTEDFTISGGASDIFTSFKPTLAIATASVGPGSDVSAPAHGAPLFVGTNVTTADVGRTFTANQDNDPNFNDFVALLTNGKLNKVTLSFGSGTRGYDELFLTKSGRLFGQNMGIFGTTIDSVSLRIDSLTLNSPGDNPNGDGVWTDYSFNGVAIIEGEPVTEPVSAIGTLAFGLVVIGFARKGPEKSRKICRF